MLVKQERPDVLGMNARRGPSYSLRAKRRFFRLVFLSIYLSMLLYKIMKRKFVYAQRYELKQIKTRLLENEN